MMRELIDPDDGVLVRADPRPWWYTRHGMVLLPILVTGLVALACWLWPPQTYDVAPLVRPPVAEAGSPVPQTIVSLAQGQPVGGEEYFKGFRLNTGWHLAPAGDYGRYNLVADVTNVGGTPDTAHVLVTIRVAERDVEMLLCRKTLMAGETGALVCADMGHAQYTSRWSRITLSAV